MLQLKAMLDEEEQVTSTVRMLIVERDYSALFEEVLYKNSTPSTQPPCTLLVLKESKYEEHSRIHSFPVWACQDHPISAALKLSPMETEAERTSRLYAEAEAKRVSEQIDDDLREERERLKKKKKGDVKLLLLGQAESGKSTLQKQFQLMYKPTSMVQERASWTAVIYFNVVHSLKHILATLEAWDDTLDEDAEAQPTSTDDSQSIIPKKARGNGIADQPSPSTSLLTGSIIQGSPSSLMPSEAGGSHSHSMKEGGALQIANLRRRLFPLVAADAQLADRLSGGISVSGSGKGGVFVHSGWQARTIENALGRIKQKRRSAESEKKTRRWANVGALRLGYPGVVASSHCQGVNRQRKRKLDEWSEFFLKNIMRVASPDYVPSIGNVALLSLNKEGPWLHSQLILSNSMGLHDFREDVDQQRNIEHFEEPKRVEFLCDSGYDTRFMNPAMFQHPRS
ncbi:uncharacterized protein LACBIDRAFT_332856 [Laccaria bicolor S238N-H82]|uniref:Predicted protein n=1 Tax=Laccaria bicolor (strain S238N-H82 / ATCC MYA-4686) TaxID=486041 RepID=B0DU33_LACBS|nr:uncharacterized protein LACBIDRAFT_332856 [Laccaria bicolor S238N-H82]EDR01833.1 predicted protein [Laccaria bicolor S238N-H82]|eukprot:XP_001887443.1 predicted protein [Laccaria bicolor S238N-H82]